jgi:diguanylate cyclase
MLGVAGSLGISAAGYWLGFIPGENGVPVVLLLSGLLSAAITLSTKAAADRGMVNRAGYSGVAFILVVCGGVCLATYVNDQGVIYGLPYCVLTAVGAAFFWLRRRHFICGQVAAFVPPVLLLLATPHTPQEWSFAIQLSSVSIVASTAIYLLTTRTNQRIYTLSSEVEHRATYDGLTGVLNRSTWIQRAERRLIEEQHLGHHTACLFIDMDRFKQINDVLGHGAGDDVLGKVAEILNQFASADRLVGRIGGDEFVMLLPGTTSKHAEVMAEQILTSLRSLDHFAGGPVASIGVASSTTTDTLDQLIHRADLAMLKVKERNRDFEVLAHDVDVRGGSSVA